MSLIKLLVLYSFQQTLNLSENSLTGELPPSFGYMTELRVLNLQKNSLNGVLPPAIASFQFLTAVMLGDNRGFIYDNAFLALSTNGVYVDLPWTATE